GTPKERMNNGSAGFFDIVELKIARPPVMHRSRNGENLFFIELRLRIDRYSSISLL
ncbi:MAG: hypothetical protein HY662_01565, partial [Chloroflexi bacterium]|nr:hypothetical protein [Chloroflexota bacterium]